jgi:hypothetical protein
MSGPLRDKQQKMGEHVENIKFSLDTTVQYRPSEKEILFGLKVPSSDGLGLIL